MCLKFEEKNMPNLFNKAFSCYLKTMLVRTGFIMIPDKQNMVNGIVTIGLIVYIFFLSFYNRLKWGKTE